MPAPAPTPAARLRLVILPFAAGTRLTSTDVFFGMMQLSSKYSTDLARPAHALEKG